MVRVITDAILRNHPNVLEHDPGELAMDIPASNLHELKQYVSKLANIAPHHQHYYMYVRRQNKTTRPSDFIQLSTFHFTSNAIVFLHVDMKSEHFSWREAPVLLLLRRYDATTGTLSHVGSTRVYSSERINAITTDNVFPDDQHSLVEYYEVVHPKRIDKLKPTAKIHETDLSNGDIICIQLANQHPAFSDYLKHPIASPVPQKSLTVIATHLQNIYNDKTWSDITIKTDDMVFHLNKCVLSCIPYFNSMFSGNMRESSQCEVVLCDVNGKTLQALFKYVYGIPDWCPNEVDALVDLVVLCDMYGMKMVEVENLLCEKLDSKNVLPVYFVISKLNIEKLLERCLAIIEKNLQVVSQTVEFPKFVMDYQSDFQLILSKVQEKLQVYACFQQAP